MKREDAIRETVLEAMNEARRLAHEEEVMPFHSVRPHSLAEKSIIRQWGNALDKAVRDILDLTASDSARGHLDIKADTSKQLASSPETIVKKYGADIGGEPVPDPREPEQS